MNKLLKIVPHQQCPICHGSNSCQNISSANTSSKSRNNCWCMSEDFPQKLLDNVASHAKNKACICQRCLHAYQQLITEIQ